MEAKNNLTTGQLDIELSADKSLTERIMRYVPNRNTFTGQVTVEVHCKDGEVKDVYLNMRNKIVI